MNNKLFLLEKQFNSFEQYCQGILGIHATHIETENSIGFHSDEHFLMCSTYKLPMAICFLQKVERGSLTLNDLYEIRDFDLRPGALVTLNQFNYETPIKISLRNLLQLMLQESCNTSTDILLKLLGGPLVVMEFLKIAEIENMRIDRTTLEILADWDGITELPSDRRITLSQYKELEKQIPNAELLSQRAAFKEDFKDRATPAAMTLLLTKLFKNELLEKNHTDLLLKILRGCKRGQMRLMGLLPAKTPVAHKTGTLMGYTCDVGIISLPHNCGHIAVSAYIKDSHKNLDNNERVLAEVGRTLYDYYMYASL